MSAQLLASIKDTNLIAYFEYLDGLRESGRTNMYGAPQYLRKQWPGMSNVEAHTIAAAWRVTFNATLPAEDRAMNALEGAR